MPIELQLYGETADNELVTLTAKLDSRGEAEEKAGCCCLREERCAHRYQAGGWQRCYIVVSTEITMFFQLNGASQLACNRIFLASKFYTFFNKQF